MEETIYEIWMTHNRAWSPRELVCFAILFLLAAAVLSTLVLAKKITVSQEIATLLAVVFLGIVFASTVFTRTPTEERKYCLELFWSWKKAFGAHSQVALKEILLNSILLAPLGFLLPFIFKKHIKIRQALLCGFLVSASIECCQLVMRRGLFEWDDMIHNAFGCMLGCVIANLFRQSHIFLSTMFAATDRRA